MPRSVADHCQAKCLTLKILVERSGLDDDRVKAILLGRWTPSPNERHRIAAALEVEIEEITWGHVTPIQHIYGHGPG